MLGVVDQVARALTSLDMAMVVVQASPLQQVQLMVQVQQAVEVAARVHTEAKCHGKKKDLVGSEQHSLSHLCSQCSELQIC